MSGKQKVLFTSLGLIGGGIIIGIALVLSGGLYSSSEITEPERVWQPPTLSDIYASFEAIDTDLDEYIWPTDITNIMTSAFGEFRSTHFHAGIDISTRGQVGASVFAARDGYIEQVGVSSFGYGKYILMRHDDGFATLYAHLDSFDDPVESRVYEYQKETGRYNIIMNFEPEEFRYHRGETIARSGSTGSGPPHIHFEIRDRNNNPVNPKLSGGIAINDRMPPVFNRIAAIPVDVHAFVNDRITPVTLPAIAIRAGEYVVRDPIRIRGTVGLAIDVHDRNNDTWYRHGIYGMDFFLDDSLVYSLRYDRLPIEHRHQIRVHYDNYLLNNRRGRFRKLFIEEGNMLPIYSRLEHGSGLINTHSIEPGLYNFCIDAFDIYGNTSTLTGSFDIGGSPVPVNEPLPPQSADRLQIPFSESELHFESRVFRDMLIVHITHPEILETPSPLIVRQGDSITSVPFVAGSGYTHQSRLQLHPRTETSVTFTYHFNDTIYTHIENIYSIMPDKRGEILIDDGNLKLTYDYGSVYYPLYFTVGKVNTDDRSYYTINSTSSVLNNGLQYSLRVPENMQPFDRTVFYTREGSRWNSIGSIRIPESRMMTATSRQLFRNISVGVDTTAPSISNVIVDGNRNMRLRFRLSDDESGIDHSSLAIRLDDDKLIGRYDPDLSMVIYRTREPLEPGTYNLKISVDDRAGNNTTYERSVTIR